jgi:hypothetical protein
VRAGKINRAWASAIWGEVSNHLRQVVGLPIQDKTIPPQTDQCTENFYELCEGIQGECCGQEDHGEIVLRIVNFFGRLRAYCRLGRSDAGPFSDFRHVRRIGGS